MTKEFLGLEFDELALDGALDWIERRLEANLFAYIVTPNVDHIVQLERRSDPELRGAYANADLILCDSRILSRLARWSDIDLTVVPGSDLTRVWLERSAAERRIAVIAGSDALEPSLKALYPQHRWQFHIPPMGVLGNARAREEIARFVEESRADLVLFAIGAPQSELCCAQIADRAQARGVALCIGASLEFIVGTKRRAPGWMQRLGLEWLFRLLSEPQRLWRRYLVEGPAIFRIWWNWHRRR